MDLIELAKACPDLNVTVRLSDLLEANERIARKIRKEAETEVERRQRSWDGDVLIKKEEARIQLLGGVNPATLWRWEQKCYLTPVKIGGSVFYQKSEIDRIVKNKRIKSTL